MNFSADTNYKELTEMLNEQGYHRECGRPFTPKNVNRIMADYGIKTMKDRYLDRGWLTVEDAAKKMNITAVGLRYRINNNRFPGEWI